MMSAVGSNFGFAETISTAEADQELTYIEAISAALREEMRRDPKCAA